MAKPYMERIKTGPAGIDQKTGKPVDYDSQPRRQVCLLFGQAELLTPGGGRPSGCARR